MKRYDNLEEVMCKELEKLDKKYGGEVNEMTTQDAEKADLLYHALKSAATYHAMKDSEEMESGRSYRGSGREESYARGRNSGARGMSREMDGGYSGGSYQGGGYSGGGYSGGYSGHYPEWMPPYYNRY